MLRVKISQGHKETFNCIIVKEALATTSASEGFSYYVLGITFTLETAFFTPEFLRALNDVVPPVSCVSICDL